MPLINNVTSYWLSYRSLVQGLVTEPIRNHLINDTFINFHLTETRGGKGFGAKRPGFNKTECPSTSCTTASVSSSVRSS